MATDAPRKLDHSVPLGAVWTTFTLTLRGLLRFKRVVVLVLLFLLPVIVAVTFRMNVGSRPSVEQVRKDFLETEFWTVYVMIANAAAPLTILLFATGMIRDEQEDQTLTYLLVRPIPKWVLYLAKLLAALLVAWLLTALGVAATMTALWFDSGQTSAGTAMHRYMIITGGLGLLLAANGALFALLSVLLKRSLILGALYIAVWEGFLANFPFMFRYFTNMYYFQGIIVGLLGSEYRHSDDPKNRATSLAWALAQEIPPDTQECIFTLLSVFVITTVLGMYLFSIREFRLKTPEGG